MRKEKRKKDVFSFVLRKQNLRFDTLKQVLVRDRETPDKVLKKPELIQMVSMLGEGPNAPVQPRSVSAS